MSDPETPAVRVLQVWRQGGWSGHWKWGHQSLTWPGRKVSLTVSSWGKALAMVGSVLLVQENSVPLARESRRGKCGEKKKKKEDLAAVPVIKLYYD